jgi:Condensation domain
VDGVSVEILWRELEVCYAALTEGRRPELPEIRLSYADFAAWEDEWLRGEEYQHQLNSLIERLRMIPPAIDLPVCGQSAGPYWRGGTHEFWIGEEDTAAALRWAAEMNVTPFTVLFLVYSGVLYRWTGQSDIVIGVPMSVRARAGLENMVGMLVNTVAVSVHWGDDPTAREALDRCGAAVAEALAARQVPFDRVAAALPRLRAAGRAPIVQVSFGYEDDRGPAAGGMRLEGTRVQVLPGTPETAKFDLSLDCRLIGGRVQCVLEWSGQRMDAELVETFATHLRAAIRQAPSRPDDRVGQWDLGLTPVATAPAWLEDDSLTDETWTRWCSASADALRL